MDQSLSEKLLLGCAVFIYILYVQRESFKQQELLYSALNHHLFIYASVFYLLYKSINDIAVAIIFMAVFVAFKDFLFNSKSAYCIYRGRSYDYFTPHVDVDFQGVSE